MKNFWDDKKYLSSQNIRQHLRIDISKNITLMRNNLNLLVGYWEQHIFLCRWYSFFFIIPAFPKKGDLGLAKNYRGITLTSIAAKIYNALLRNLIEPKIDNILRKKQNGLRRNRPTSLEIMTIRRRFTRKKPRGDNIICRLYEGLWLHSQRKDGANPSRIRPTRRNSHSHNDAL